MINNSALKELHLNIEKQKIDMKKHDKLGYQFDKNTFVFVISIPLKKSKEIGENEEEK